MTLEDFDLSMPPVKRARKVSSCDDDDEDYRRRRDRNNEVNTSPTSLIDRNSSKL